VKGCTSTHHFEMKNFSLFCQFLCLHAFNESRTLGLYVTRRTWRSAVTSNSFRGAPLFVCTLHSLCGLVLSQCLSCLSFFPSLFHCFSIIPSLSFYYLNALISLFMSISFPLYVSFTTCPLFPHSSFQNFFYSPSSSLHFFVSFSRFLSVVLRNLISLCTLPSTSEHVQKYVFFLV
jgi:hypothetical protein